MTDTLAPAPRTGGPGPAFPGAFTMPAISPLSGPPPYRYRDCSAVNVLFRTDPVAMEALVPAPLTPDPEQPLVLYAGHYQFADFEMPYNEAGLLVPVRHRGAAAGTFAVVLYLDTAGPIVGGREIYGWPKKDADRIRLEEHEGHISAEVVRYGRTIIRVSVEMGREIDPIPPRPSAPIHFLKLIPSIEEGGRPDVAKLNSLTIEPDVITRLRVGRGRLTLGDSPYDAFLARIPVGEVVYSEAITHDFTLGYGHVVHDYLEALPG